MNFLKILIILFLVTSFSELRSGETNDVLKNKILKNIRCLICQGQSVYDSESDKLNNGYFLKFYFLKHHWFHQILIPKNL